MQSVVLKISVQPHTLLHVHVVVQLSSLMSSTDANCTSNETGIRYDNWIAVYHGVCVVAASPQASSTIMFIGSCSSLDILLLFRRYS